MVVDTTASSPSYFTLL